MEICEKNSIIPRVRENVQVLHLIGFSGTILANPTSLHSSSWLKSTAVNFCFLAEQVRREADGKQFNEERALQT